MADQENDAKSYAEEAPPGRLLTTKEAASLLHMGRKQFLALSIPYVQLGKRTRRYRREDLDKFVRSRIRYDHPLPTYEQRTGPAYSSWRFPTWKGAGTIAERQTKQDVQRTRGKTRRNPNYLSWEEITRWGGAGQKALKKVARSGGT